MRESAAGRCPSVGPRDLGPHFRVRQRCQRVVAVIPPCRPRSPLPLLNLMRSPFLGLADFRLLSPAYHRDYLNGDLVDGVRPRATGHFVCQRGTVADQLLFRNLMPDWQENLLPGNRAGNQAIKLIVGPALAKEGARQHDDPEAALREPSIDLAVTRRTRRLGLHR